MNLLLNLFNLALFGCQATFVASVHLRNANDGRNLQLGNPCGAFDWCPNGFSCDNGKCYHVPRQEGEPCGILSYCDDNLDCDSGVCVDRFDKGVCAEDSGSAPTLGTIKVMSYNLFLINCVLKVPLYGELVPCQREKEDRAEEIAKWAKKRNDDVIMFQEVFDEHDTIKAAMNETTYCHYLTTRKAYGSGLAIYSKYPIEEHDFQEWPLYLNPESIAKKGVLYAKIKRGGEYIHFFNMHTMSDSLGAGSGQRFRHDQFQITRTFINQKVISKNELILLGGDLNENKYEEDLNEDKYSEYYEGMLQDLNASAFRIGANGNLYTYDTKENGLTRSKYAEGHRGYRQLLDYILYDNRGLQPKSESNCLIRIPRGTKVTDTRDPTRMLSDHFPVVCNITYIKTDPPKNSPMFVVEVLVIGGSVCDADNWPAGDSDPYISVKIRRNGFDHECGTTERLSNTNNPQWNELIRCNNVHFKATDFTELVLSAYDHDTGTNGQDDFIGGGTACINTDMRVETGNIILRNGDCNNDGTLEFQITIKEVS